MAHIKIYKCHMMHFCACSHRFKMFTFQIVDLQKVAQGHTMQFSKCFHSIANIKVYKNRPKNFCSSVSEILMFKICHFRKIGQDHRVQFSQCCHSLANIKIYKSHGMHFWASSKHFNDINVSNFWLSKKQVKVTGQGHCQGHRSRSLSRSQVKVTVKVTGQGHCVQFSQCCISMANIKIY